MNTCTLCGIRTENGIEINGKLICEYCVCPVCHADTARNHRMDYALDAKIGDKKVVMFWRDRRGNKEDNSFLYACNTIKDNVYVRVNAYKDNDKTVSLILTLLDDPTQPAQEWELQNATLIFLDDHPELKNAICEMMEQIRHHHFADTRIVRGVAEQILAEIQIQQ